MSRRLEHDWFPGSVPHNVVIGEGTWLYSSYAFLHYRSQRPCGLCTGTGCGIYINTLFDLGPSAEVVVGDHTMFAGPLVSTDNRVVIGSHVLFSSQVVVADSFAAQPARAGADIAVHEPATVVVIDDLAWIGTRAILLAGARIGEGAVVGAGTVVDGDVPPYAIIAGDPARVIGWSRPGQPREAVAR